MSDESKLVYKHPSGSVECKVCLSTHASMTSYLSHAQGKRHKQNIARYNPENDTPRPTKPKPRRFHKIGIPKYDVVKLRDPKSSQLGLRVELQVPDLNPKVVPQIRIMSAWEQSVEEVNPKYQYLVVAAEPYDSVALRIPSLPIDESSRLTHLDADRGIFYAQILFERS